MRENAWLAHIFARSANSVPRFPQIIVGPGDDCAVLARVPGPLLLKVDQLIESRHFRAYPTTSIELIARKAVARTVSDIAAMAGVPIAGLCAATIPSTFDRTNELFDAVASWAERFGCPLAGGDIATVPGASGLLALSMTVVGVPHATRGAVLRSTACVGDDVYVTGALGGSFDSATGLGRHLTFEPRVREATWLADTLGARLHAMMDISDGLGLDAARLARASGVRVEIDAAALPRATLASGALVPWQHAIGDGEDYELLFSASGDVPTATPQGTAITRIGAIIAGEGCVATTPEGVIDVSNSGWQHGA